MAWSHGPALAVALLFLTAGCQGAASGSLDVTPAPVPTDDPPLVPGHHAVVDLANDRRIPYAVSVTVVEGDVPHLEVMWTNSTATAIELDPSGQATIRQQATRGDVRDLGLPDYIKSTFTVEAAEPGATATVYLRSSTPNPTVLVEVRPLDDEGRWFGAREPLMLAIVVDCQRSERVGSIHIDLGSSVDVDRSNGCVPTG